MIEDNNRPERPSAKYLSGNSHSVEGITAKQENAHTPDIFPPGTLRNSLRRTILLLLAVCFIAVTASLVAAKQRRDAGILPKNVTSQAAFPVYLPASLPANYEISRASSRYSEGSIFYTVTDGTHSITISEQAVPSPPPDLKALGDLKTIDTTAGTAVYGLSEKKPFAILLTNTTLVTLNGEANVPSDVIAAVVKALSSTIR